MTDPQTISTFTPSNTNYPSGTLISNTNGTSSYLGGNTNVTFTVPLPGSGSGQASSTNNLAAEEIANAIDAKNHARSQQLQSDVVNAKNNALSQGANAVQQTQGLFDSIIPQFGSVQVQSSSNPSFWLLEIPMAIIPGGKISIDLNPIHQPWILAIADFIRTGLVIISTTIYIFAIWKEFRITLRALPSYGQMQGADGGALGGTISAPIGVTYALLATTFIASIVPLISAFINIFGTPWEAVQGIQSLGQVVASRSGNWGQAIIEGWMILITFIPVFHIILCYITYLANTFKITTYAMTYATLLRFFVR